MQLNDINPLTAREEADIFKDLQELCFSDGYIHAFSFFCWRDNLIRFSGSSITEKDMQHQYSHGKLIRTELSILQGLMVKGYINIDLPSPKILQMYIDKSEEFLHEIHMSLQKPWAKAFALLANDPSKAKELDPFSTAEGLREPIFYSGESAYNFQYSALAQIRYKYDERWLEDNFGFNIEDAILIATLISDLQLEKISTLRKSMLSVPTDKITTLSGFTFKINEIRTSGKTNFEKVERFLNVFSIDGPKRNASFRGISDFNEVLACPIIKLSNGDYFLSQSYNLLESIYESPFFWMMRDKSYRATASKHRGSFAEAFLADRLEHVFGKQHVYRNVDIYKGKDRFAEADILVIYGDQTIVVQAKSKRLTIESRKGNDLQLKDDFKKAIDDAYKQALLCSEAIKAEGFRFLLPSGEYLTKHKSTAKIFILCAVADHYPALAAQTRQFLDVKSTEIVQPPIISDLFFLDVLTEILSSPLQLLNYLYLRSKFDDRLLVSQELTVLGYHLKHNLWFEDKYNMINLGDEFTSPIDIAMSARRVNLPGERTPRGILSRFDGSHIGTIISQIEASATPNLVGLGLLFLKLSSDAAMHVNNAIKTIVRMSARDGRHHDFSIPSEIDKSGFTFHTNPLPDIIARERLVDHCNLRKYDTKSDAWYGVLLSPGDGRVRCALAVRQRWKINSNMDRVLKAWPRKSLIPIKSLNSQFQKRKIGRNESCLCGSGKKYKFCCLK